MARNSILNTQSSDESDLLLGIHTMKSQPNFIYPCGKDSTLVIMIYLHVH